MSEFESTESYVHRLDGTPDERAARRVPTHNLTLRNPVPGRVVDLTEEGVGVECNEPLKVFHRYPFTLVVGRRRSKLRRQGVVRWSRLTAAGVDTNGEPEMVYRVGISFL